MDHSETKAFSDSDAGIQIYQLIERLYPICRSITGNGVRETLSIISEIIPITVHEIPSGAKAFDWEIPNEWNINDGWIKNAKGEKIVDFKKLNLHVLNYSTPVDEKMELAELKKHLFTIPEYPELTPYRTSYHNKNWGFCMPHNQFEKLGNETYEVKIDSTLEPGSLTYGEYFIKGKTNDEVLISCHVCHPSLCNDNLSGVAVATYVAKLISGMDLHYSYRFIFIPGTIGSIAWLSVNEKKVDQIKHGLVLTLLGDASNFTYKKSRRGNTEIDMIIENLLKSSKNPYRVVDFSPYGYDERQFCSPGFNLPVGNLSRAVHGEFREYHTSADDLDFVEQSQLADSYDFILKIVKTVETNRTYLNTNPKCEPQLGKRGLFSKIGGKSNTVDYHMAILWVLNYSDGEHSLIEISNKSGYDYNLILEAAKALEQVELLNVVK